MTAIHSLILLLTGAVAGFAGGMFGLGGGFIMSPVQYWVYQHQGIEPDLAIRIAFGTSLLVVLAVAISGTLAHHREKAVKWKTVFVMGGFSMAGSFTGAILAASLPVIVLKTAFGCVVMIVAARMLASAARKEEREPNLNPWVWVAWAFPVGVLTGIIGIGGGLVLVPVLALSLRFRLRNAIATSMAIVMFSAAGGVAGYIIEGFSVTSHLDWTVGYINLQSWFLLTISSVGMARIGAWATHRLPEKQVRYAFIILLIYTGLRMIGVFEWLGWPL